MRDGFVEEAGDTWGQAGFGEDAGQGGPFPMGFGEVGVDGWPVIIIGRHDAAQVLEGGDGLKGRAMDCDRGRLGCLVGSEGQPSLLCQLTAAACG